MTRWLTSPGYVGANRIAFYGNNGGGRTALRVPLYVPAYRTVICSADFNQRPPVTTSGFARSDQCSIGVYECNQGDTFGLAQMAMLLAPGPSIAEDGCPSPVRPAE